MKPILCAGIQRSTYFSTFFLHLDSEANSRALSYEANGVIDDAGRAHRRRFPDYLTLRTKHQPCASKTQQITPHYLL